MKKLFTTTLLSVSIAITSFADTATKIIDSKAKEVTVFLKGAQVNRTTTSKTVNSGTTELVIKNLSPNIDANSIQVSGQGNFTILSVTNNRNYLYKSEKPKEILNLEDSLEYFNNKLDDSKALSSAYKDEKGMILTVSKSGEKTATQIEAIANLYRTRLFDLNKKILKSNKKEKDYSDKITQLRNQLNSLNNKRNKATSDIVITVQALTKTTASFNVSYYVYDAGWSPAYEIRAKDAGAPIDFRYKANVHQNTGEQWDDVILTLSTGNPTRNNNQPILRPWRLSFNENKFYDHDAVNMYNKGLEIAEVVVMGDRAKKTNTKSSSDFTTVAQTGIATEFKIDLKQTIESNNKNLKVEIQQHQLAADYTFFAAPKLDKDAFLLAKITGWEQYNLLSGQANIFYKGTYVGKSYINTNNANDTLDISLGRDKDIKIERTKLKDFTKKRAIGANKKETFAWDINIRNNKNTPIKLILQDQVPVSANNSIEIEVLNSSNAKIDNETGIVNWEFFLAPAKSNNLKLVYSVKYPANKRISNL